MIAVTADKLLKSIGAQLKRRLAMEKESCLLILGQQSIHCRKQVLGKKQPVKGFTGNKVTISVLV